MDGFTDRVAIVTGASSGIGRACARALAREGAQMVLVGRDRERLDRTARECETEPLVIAADLTVAGTAADVVARTVERFGRIDILHSNAGVYLSGDFAEAEASAVRTLIDTNVFAAMEIVRAALPPMIEAGRGDVIMTSSVAGHQAIHWEPVYSASKHAIQAFSHGVRRQLAGTGVRLGAIAPGVVLNELWGVGEDDDTAAKIAAAEGITSDDVADAVLFMLSRPRHVNVRDLVLLPTSQEI